MFAQKKTKEEIENWNEVWNEASKQYNLLKTRVENLIAVSDGTKDKKKLKSIKDLTSSEETEIIKRMLKSYITDKDDSLTAEELIKKYRPELETLCSIDKETKEQFGFVNTWWVFGEVVKTINYDVFMAEAENVGYKRSKRGEKQMPNDLYRVSANDNIIVDDGTTETILDMMRELDWE